MTALANATIFAEISGSSVTKVRPGYHPDSPEGHFLNEKG